MIQFNARAIWTEAKRCPLAYPTLSKYDHTADVVDLLQTDTLPDAECGELIKMLNITIKKV